LVKNAVVSEIPYMMHFLYLEKPLGTLGGKRVSVRWSDDTPLREVDSETGLTINEKLWNIGKELGGTPGPLLDIYEMNTRQDSLEISYSLTSYWHHSAKRHLFNEGKLSLDDLVSLQTPYRPTSTINMAIIGKDNILALGIRSGKVDQSGEISVLGAGFQGVFKHGQRLKYLDHKLYEDPATPRKLDLVCEHPFDSAKRVCSEKSEMIGVTGQDLRDVKLVGAVTGRNTDATFVMLARINGNVKDITPGDEYKNRLYVPLTKRGVEDYLEKTFISPSKWRERSSLKKLVSTDHAHGVVMAAGACSWGADLGQDWLEEQACKYHVRLGEVFT